MITLSHKAYDPLLVCAEGVMWAGPLRVIFDVIHVFVVVCGCGPMEHK